MRTGLGVLFDVVLLGKFYVHVGLGGGEGDGSVEFLAVGGEYVGHGELLVVVCEGVSGDKLLSAGNQNLFGISICSSLTSFL
jgi:hypothetical protein